LSRAHFKDELTIEVWSENWQIFQIFAFDLATQWRVGMCGATGLDYNVLPFIFRTRGIPRSEWATAFDDIRAMEAEALKEMQKE
jgi:hypothetical protein